MRSILLSVCVGLILCIDPISLLFPEHHFPKIDPFGLPDIDLFLIDKFMFFQRLYFVHDMLGIGNQIFGNHKWRSYIVFFYKKILRLRDMTNKESSYLMNLFIETSDGNMRDIDERLHLEIFLDVINWNSHLRVSYQLWQFQPFLVWFGRRRMSVYYFFIYAIKHYYYHHLLVMSIYIRIAVLITVVMLAKSDGYCGKENCYEVLGVARDADENTIKKAFREMAKRYHPDKNRQEDTTELFQIINKAYQTLTNQKARFKYDLHLQNPEESDYYHEYRYYQRKFIQNPQVHPLLVIAIVLVLISSLQYIMRKQMYERAIMQITEGHDFKTKLNERCRNNKKIKDTIKEEMIEEISIEGGYSMPTYKDILLYKTVAFPITICQSLYGWSRWIFKYYIKREEYSPEDQNLLTMKALSISARRWEHFEQQEKKMLIGRRLWVKEKWKAYEQEMRDKWLEQLKENKPRQYQMVMKHMKKTQ